MMFPFTKKAPTTTITSVVIFLFTFLFAATYIYSNYKEFNINATNSHSSGGSSTWKNTLLSPKKNTTKISFEFPFNCSSINVTNGVYRCPTTPISSSNFNSSLTKTSECPNYFSWIHEDLSPWKKTGITMEMVNRAERTASFRLVILKGKAYVVMYRKSFESRDTFTLWGILQLVRRYQGLMPDLDMMFDSKDRPVIQSRDYVPNSPKAPPPLFRYCGKASFLDIVFPDWSFWGWPEINIRPWDKLLEDIKEGNMRSKWMERDPYAYWKGNPNVAGIRKELLKCNVTDKQDWNARIYAQDWAGETQKGFKQSNLANQCTHRYKIYIEGSAWSVSEKYILACDSPTLMIKPKYFDFFTRSLLPLKHYWPIKYNDKCRSIKFAVDWGTNHTDKVQEIGHRASNFIQNDLKMEYVYDYMFHLLKEYSNLLRYKPIIPPKAVEFCVESMVCAADGLRKQFMMESMVKKASDSAPCSMPPPPSPSDLQSFFKKKFDSIKEVEMWENKYWESQPK